MLLIISGINRANEDVIFDELFISDDDVIDSMGTYKVIKVTEDNKQDLLNFVSSVVEYNLGIDEAFSYLKISVNFCHYSEKDFWYIVQEYHNKENDKFLSLIGLA